MYKSQLIISFSSQSKLGYEKYRMRKDGMAKRTVISKYNNMTAALAGMTYNTIRRNMSTSGNLVVKLTMKIRDFCKEELKLLALR